MRSLVVVSALAIAATASSCAAIIELGPEREKDEIATEGDGRVWCDDGLVLWVKQLGDKAQQSAASIAPDGAGGVFIAGFFAGMLDLGGPEPLVALGSNDIFLAHLDADGGHVWSRQLGHGGGGTVAVTATQDGGLVVAGEFRGEVDFGDGMKVVPVGFADGFIARYDAAGNHLWHRIISGPSTPHSELFMEVAVGADGAMVAGAIFVETMSDFGGQPITSAGMKDMWIIELEPSGELRWSAQLGGTLDDVVNSVVIDEANRVVVGGGSTGPVDMGKGPLDPLDPTDSWDALIGLYEPTRGDAIRTDRFGGPGTQNVNRLAIDPTSNDLLLAGGLTNNGKTDFGDEAVEAVHGGFIARLTADGAHVASAAIEGFASHTSLHVDPEGNVLLSGYFDTSVDFDDEVIESNGLKDGLLAKLDPSLRRIWTLRLGSARDDTIAGVAVDGASEPVVLAHFHETISLFDCPVLTSRGSSDVLILKLRP